MPQDRTPDAVLRYADHDDAVIDLHVPTTPNGTLDDEVPVELSRGFVAAHPWAALTELPGTGHYEFLDPTSAAWDATEALLRVSG